MEAVHLKYLAVNPVDLQWGTAVNSVGFQEIAPGMAYPPRNHPSRYIFTIESGRVLEEYQLLYITEGRGKFYCQTLGRSKPLQVESGMMFLLFPGEWHSYHPDRQTGWKEYWIGFNGHFVDNLIERGFFSKDRPVFKVNIHEDIVAMYNDAINAAVRQESGFQQFLAGIVGRLLSLAYYYDRNSQYSEAGNRERARPLGSIVFSTTPAFLFAVAAVIYRRSSPGSGRGPAFSVLTSGVASGILKPEAGVYALLSM